MNARNEIESLGVDNLVVDDLTNEDLSKIGWSGSATHIRSVKKALERVQTGEVEYLAIRALDGEPIAKGGIDYAAHDGAGTLWQFATRDDLQGLGLGTKLIAAAEDRVRKRGVRSAILAVEVENPSARRLYERLGYREVGQERDSWEQEDEHGNVYTYEAELIVLRKEL